MAKKRMTTTQVTDSDEFISLPSASQALYLHLNNSCDDDGFTNQVQMAMFKAHASVDDLKLLMMKSFIIQFENGVIVIKHWRMANAIRKDRYTPTVFQEEFKQLGIKENLSYTRLPSGCQVVAIGKDRLGKDSLDKDNSNKTKRFVPPTYEEVEAYCKERNNNVNPQRFIDFYESKGWLVGRAKMKDWKASVRTWEHTKHNEKVDDKLPVYDASKNKKYDDDYIKELLSLRDK